MKQCSNTSPECNYFSAGMCDGSRWLGLKEILIEKPEFSASILSLVGSVFIGVSCFMPSPLLVEGGQLPYSQGQLPHFSGKNSIFNWNFQDSPVYQEFHIWIDSWRIVFDTMWLCSLLMMLIKRNRDVKVSTYLCLKNCVTGPGVLLKPHLEPEGLCVHERHFNLYSAVLMIRWDATKVGVIGCIFYIVLPW